MIDDGRYLALLGLLGIAGAAAVRRAGSKGIVRRSPSAKKPFDVEEMIDRLILLEVDDSRMGWVAYDPEHELECNVFHIFGKSDDLGITDWHTAAHESKIEYSTQTVPPYVLFVADGVTYEGTVLGTGRRAMHERILGTEKKTVDAFRRAILSCTSEAGSRGIVRRSKPALPRELLIERVPVSIPALANP